MSKFSQKPGFLKPSILQMLSHDKHRLKKIAIALHLF